MRIGLSLSNAILIPIFFPASLNSEPSKDSGTSM